MRSRAGDKLSMSSMTQILACSTARQVPLFQSHSRAVQSSLPDTRRGPSSEASQTRAECPQSVLSGARTVGCAPISGGDPKDSVAATDAEELCDKARFED